MRKKMILFTLVLVLGYGILFLSFRGAFSEKVIISTKDHSIVWDRTDPKDCSRGLVVINHGFLEHRGMYKHVSRALKEHGFSTVRYDLRGHGESQAPRYHITDFNMYISDLNRLVGQVHKNPKIPLFIMGHSMGGLISVIYASQSQANPHQPLGTFGNKARHPKINGVILLAPALSLYPGRTDGVWGSLEVLLGQGVRKVWPTKEWPSPKKVENQTNDLDEQARMMEDPLMGDWATVSLLLELTGAIGKSPQYLKDWKFKKDTIFFQGLQDLTVNPEENLRVATERLTENSETQIMTFPTGRHSLYLGTKEVRTQVLKHIIDFLKSRTGECL